MHSAPFVAFDLACNSALKSSVTISIWRLESVSLEKEWHRRATMNGYLTRAQNQYVAWILVNWFRLSFMSICQCTYLNPRDSLPLVYLAQLIVTNRTTRNCQVPWLDHIPGLDLKSPSKSNSIGHNWPKAQAEQARSRPLRRKGSPSWSCNGKPWKPMDGLWINLWETYNKWWN